MSLAHLTGNIFETRKTFLIALHDMPWQNSAIQYFPDLIFDWKNDVKNFGQTQSQLEYFEIFEKVLETK